MSPRRKVTDRPPSRAPRPDPPPPHDAVEVVVRERLLWVDGDAYPVHNIARVRSLVLRPDNRPALRQAAVRCGVAGFSAIGAELIFGEFFDTGPVIAVAVIGVVVSLVLLLIELGRPSRYAFVVETTGFPKAVLISDEPDEVFSLVDSVADAINNPEAEFRYTIHNAQFGDSITQIGDRNAVHKR